MRRFALALALIAAQAAPADASAMPRADFEAGQLTLSAGMNGLYYLMPYPVGSVDFALTDQLSLGAAATAWMSLARATFKVWGSPSGAAIGLTGSGGFNNEQLIFGVLGPYWAIPTTSIAGARAYYDQRMFQGPWGQLAIAGTWPVFGAGSPLVLRGMLGPVVGTGVFEAPMTPATGGAVPMEQRLTVALVPNVELAYRLTPNQEITLGGFGYVAWRGTFW